MIDASFKKVFSFYQSQQKKRPHAYAHKRECFSPMQIFSLAQLEGHLNNPLLSPAWLQLVEKGKIVDLREMCFCKNVQGRDLFFMDKLQVQQSIARGAAVVLEGLDILDQRLNRFVAALDQTLPCALANCETFFSQKGNEAYYGHRDSDDVLVLQIEGSKIWHIYEPQQRRYFNNAPLTEAQMGKKIIELELNPGDALFVRAGVPHRCQTPKEYSLHLSFDLIDKTPNPEQLSREANDHYFNASEEPYADAGQVIKRYVEILQGGAFQRKAAEATTRAQEKTNAMRALIGRSSAVQHTARKKK